MSAPKGLFKKYLNDIFIETGTFKGDGVQMAIEAGFQYIYSIELSDLLYQKCLERFSNMDGVLLIQGDSSNKLPELLSHLNATVTFWLDGHYSGILEGEQTALGEVNSPLMAELEAIKNHHIKTHTILIDDLRGWKKETHGFDVQDLMNKIIEINPDYVFTFDDGYDYELNITYPNDILVARCL